MGKAGRLARRKSYITLMPLIAVLVITGCQAGKQCNIVPDSSESGCMNEVTRISRVLDKPKYAGIISAIDFHPGDYLIRTTAGHQRFSDSLLGDYLDNFEMVGALVQSGDVSSAMAYEELGFELEKAWCNKDVRDYIHQARNSGEPGAAAKERFAAFEELAEYCLAKDNKTCQDMDRMELLPQQ